MMPDTKIYEGIYLVVSVRQHGDKGKWIRIWGSGGFWTVFISDTESLTRLLIPILENDLLTDVQLRPSSNLAEADLGIARLDRYCLLEDPDEIWL